MEPIVPKKAGQKMSVWNMVKFFGTFITRIHRFWANRATVVDPIVDAVGPTNRVEVTALPSLIPYFDVISSLLRSGIRKNTIRLASLGKLPALGLFIKV